MLIRLLVDLPRHFGRHFRGFRRYTGNHMFGLAALNLVMTWAEGIGLALFYPLLHNAGDSKEDDGLARTFDSILGALGVEATPLAVLPLIVAVFMFKGALMQITYSYQAYLAAELPLRLRRELVGSLRRIDYRALDTTNTGFVSNLLVNEVYKVAAGFICFVRAFPPTLNIIVFFGMVLWLDWKLTVMCVLMGVVAIGIVGVTGRVAAAASRATTREGAVLTGLLIQVVQAFKYLRATAGFGAFEDKLGDSAKRLAKAEYKSGAVGALSQALAQPMMVLLLAGIIYYQVAIERQPLGSLFVLLLYFFRIMNELWTLQAQWQGFMSYSGAVDLVYDTADTYRSGVEKLGTRDFAQLTERITLTDLSYAYDAERRVLHDIQLEIPKNSTIAFVGESGSGKSTLVDLIVGTLKPTAGTIAYDGVSLAEYDLAGLRKQVGYVPQDATLFEDTVANNISLWKPATDEAILEAAQQAKCREFIAEMPKGLASQVGDRGVKLSGGQRQRIAIARELFKKPSILVLDEATSALDTESERAIQQSIEALEGEMTILIIAHRLSTIRHCGRICVLHQGRIVESGSYGELLARPGSRFARLCQLQELSREIEA